MDHPNFCRRHSLPQRMEKLEFCMLLIIAVAITGIQCQTNLSTYDNEFYVGFYEHVHTAQTHQLYIHTYKTTSVSFTVTSADGGFSYTGTCTHLSPAVVNIPFSYEVRGYDYSWRHKGLKVQSLETEHISIIGWSYRSTADYMAYLAYPCHKQPTNEYIYYAVSSLGWSDQKSLFLIVGCQDNTNVTVIPKGTVTLPTDAQDSNSGTISVSAGESHSVILHAMQTLMIYVPYVDLTASKIISDQPLTVVSGHEASRVPAGTFDADPIVTQVPATVQWGKTFLLSPHSGRNAQNFRMIASMDNTVILRKCGSDALVNSTMHADQWSEFYTTGTIYCSVVSNKPIYLAQLGVSTYYSGGSYGDPSINTVAPMEQYLNSVQYTTFTASSHYYSVVMPNDEYYNGNLIFDGSLQTISGWYTIYYSDGSIAGYGYSASTTGSHTITHPNANGKLFVSVYGWTTYGGYSYAAGMSLNPQTVAYNITEITFTKSEYVVTEVNGTIYIAVERTKLLTGDVAVKFSITSLPVNTAVDGKDYISYPGFIVNFESEGSTLKSIPIQILGDDCKEPTEYFTIRIESINGSIIFPYDEAVVTIQDDDDTNCDECLVDNGGCEQNCYDTISGSHYCTCNDSYQLNFDGKTCQPNCSNPCGNCLSCQSVDQCECIDGWMGESCCTDVNECDTDNGGCQQTCNNRDGAFYCGCDRGYTVNRNHLDCDDIDECADGTNGCNHNCSNTNGSYVCFCFTGYELHDNMQTCTDINECEVDNGGCDHQCINTDGSYQCVCNDGYQLDSNLHSCNDINECLLGTDTCEHNCYNTIGSFNCDCQQGYTLNDGFFCSDINECLTQNGGCDQICRNDVGSYHCACQDGFELNDDLHSCPDIDECAENLHICEQQCSNSIGSYSCSCISGYRLAANNKTCDDIDECFEGISGCSQYCVNNVGSYYCTCDNGYLLNSDQHTCDDIIECDSNNGDCEHNCNNIVGSYYCSCNTGYSLADDQHDCTDIDECSVYNGGCGHICINFDGSYSCDCYNGYTLATNGHNCSDINECETNNVSCTQNCINTEGSFSCACYDGYSLNDDTISCSDINECDKNNGGCEQKCDNNEGSFVCSCFDGYQKSESTTTFCSDINECSEDNGGCDQICINTMGSYYCTCFSGYSLNSKNKTCDDIDECNLKKPVCAQECVNTKGSYFCRCDEGFQLNKDGSNCTGVSTADKLTSTTSTSTTSTPSLVYILPAVLIIIVLLTILVVLLTILVVAVWILRRKIKQKELEPTHYAPYDDAHSLSGDSSNITKANPLYMDIEDVQDTTGLVDESAYEKTSYDDD